MGDVSVSISPSSAWSDGTNLNVAVMRHPMEVRAWLYKEVARLCRDIDASKTLTTDEQLQFTCRAILDEFPALKLEEVHIVFDMLRMGKFGKLYERLKTAEILTAIRDYEGEVRAPILEASHASEKATPIFKEALQRMKLSHHIDEIQTSPRTFSGEGVGTRLKKKLG